MNNPLILGFNLVMSIVSLAIYIIERATMGTALLQIDNDLIDPETGEVIEQSAPLTEILPRLCNGMKSIDTQVGFQEDFRNTEVAYLQKAIEMLPAVIEFRADINKVEESVADKITKLYAQHDKLMSKAEQFGYDSTGWHVPNKGG